MDSIEFNRLKAIVDHRYFYSTILDTLCFREDLNLFNIHVPVKSQENSSGYHRVTIDGKTRYLHRITFLFLYGYLPEIVDHIDGNPSNNSKGNLRAATAEENSMNKGGVEGVRVRNGRYQGYIGKNNKQICLGTFGTQAEAIAARGTAEKIYFGEFKRNKS
tara:strand:+ start:643 stop:1125 length:483 start_codon:yes stop_codon:yes gene_type:complete